MANMSEDEIEYKPTNRNRALTGRGSSRYYCGGCDANHISNGERCEVCGRIDRVNCGRKRRFKSGKYHLT